MPLAPMYASLQDRPSSHREARGKCRARIHGHAIPKVRKGICQKMERDLSGATQKKRVGTPAASRAPAGGEGA